jgi:hypothetical protein
VHSPCSGNRANFRLRTLAQHIGITAGITFVLVVLGLELGTALLVGMVAGCAAMVLGGGHGASTLGGHGTGRERDGAPPAHAAPIEGPDIDTGRETGQEGSR